MARVSRDSDSWKASGVKARDARHDHGSTEVPRQVGRRKNTRRWCKGKSGREHVWTAETDHHLGRFAWQTFVCESCGKKDLREVTP